MICLRQKNTHDLRALCGDNQDAWQVLRSISACRGGAEALDTLTPILMGETERAAVAELKALLDLPADSGYADRVRLVVIANPNAPTGMAIPVWQIAEIVKSNPDALALIDEAYAAVALTGSNEIPSTKGVL